MHRIAIVVNSLKVPWVVKDLVDWANAQPHLEICALLVCPLPTQSGFAKYVSTMRRFGPYCAFSGAAFELVSWLEKSVVLAPRQRAFFAVDAVGEGIPLHLMTPMLSGYGPVYEFNDDDVDRVRRLDLDILVHCGMGALRGDILGTARFGLFSVVAGDSRIKRGGPPGFWEVLERHPCTGFSVQRFDAEIVDGEVYCRGSFLTEIFYSSNQARFLERSNHYLKKILLDVLKGRKHREDSLLYAKRLYSTPLFHHVVHYVFQTCGAVLRRLASGALDRRFRWKVSYVYGSWRGAVLCRARTVSNPPGRFLADPFVIEQDARNYIFAEDFDFNTKKGNIAVYRIELDGTATALGTAIDEPFHLSFPFLFRHEGEIYMVPESSKHRDIRLYVCLEFPLKWKLHSIAMDNIQAVDTLMFERHGRWWMLTNINTMGSGSNDSELHLFHSDTPLGTWTSHPDNPVVLDAACGRNGGLLTDADGLYRVAQRPGFQRYGQGVSIFKIDSLSERAYRETKVQDVTPAFYPGLKGIHHLHHTGNLLAFDRLSVDWI